MFYKDYYIDTTTYNFITVEFMGDDIVFDSIEEAKDFIDEMVRRENDYEDA